jgi:segregation and condensation protein A
MTVEQNIMQCEDRQQVVATYQGRAIMTLPQGLYVSPDALRVFLETFEGPLDLLLYLIRKQNLDLLNIPVAEVTRQYMEYIALMQNLNLELAAEYLVMAAILVDIKSQLLLPQRASENLESSDPKTKLVCKLQEYEQFKRVAKKLDQIPRVERDVFMTKPLPKVSILQEQSPYKVELTELLSAWEAVLQRVKHKKRLQVRVSTLSVRERMATILDKMNSTQCPQFSDFCSREEGPLGVVVTFIAILELIRQSVIKIVQSQPCGCIWNVHEITFTFGGQI